MSHTPSSDTDDRGHVALIGCGQWGQNLARNLARLGALRTICDPNAANLAKARAQHPEVHTTAELTDVLADPQIRACVVAAPAALHHAIGRHCLEADRDVLIEKPLALTVAEGQSLVDLARSRRRLLMVGHLLEYHPAIERLGAMVRSGELGKIHYIYCNRLNLGRIRTEENALWSFAPHDIHVLHRLLGEAPVEVQCQGGSYLSHAVADVTMSILRFGSGVRAHIFVSWLHPFKDHKLIVVGSQKMAVFDDLSEHKLQLYPHRVDWIERMPVAIRGAAEPVAIDAAEPLEREVRHFLDCIRTRETPRTDGDGGVRVLLVLQRCQQSLERGGVPLPLVESAPAPTPQYIAHPTATIDAGAQIGPGTRIWHYSHVMPDARIGRGCSLGQNVFVAKGVVIGDNVKIQNNVSVYEGVTLEDDVFCGPSMVFTNVINPRSAVSRKDEYRPTRVRRGATIGANATILCGHTIGQYAFIAAGAVVTDDVPDHALMIGVPARVAGWMCACGVRLRDEPAGAGRQRACPACEAVYETTTEGVAPCRA